MARKSANNNNKKSLAAAATVAILALGGPTAAAAQLGYIPPANAGCPQNVKVQIQAQSRSGGWLSSPTVSGRATVLNGESYSVPVQSVEIMVFPANSPVAPVYTDCWGIGSGQRVPYSPVPFQYGRASCTFQANLPTNGPSAGARNWQQARAVVTLTNGAKCYSDMTPINNSGGGGGGGGWPWIIGGANPSEGGGMGMGSSGPGMGMGSSGPGMGMGSSGGGGGMSMGMGSSGGGGMGMGTGSSRTGGGGMGMGSSRMVGGANPSSSSSSGGGSDGGMMMVGGSKPPTAMLGGANPTKSGGRRMLGVVVPADEVRA